MKQVQDKDGNVVNVPDDTPCHAGKNGALPIWLDETLDASMFADIAEREAKAAVEKAEWEADSIPRNALVKISVLEKEVTQRRLRDAILGNDDGWLVNQEGLIEIERAKLIG